MENENNTTQNKSAAKNDQSWQSAALMHIATASLEETRRSRRWRVFFLLVFFSLIWYGVAKAPSGQFPAGKFSTEFARDGSDKEHVAVIKIRGVIVDNFYDVNNTYVGLGSLLDSLKRAADDPLCKGIILSVSSPGGGIYESARLHETIEKFRADHPEKRVVAVAGDIALSGGTYVAMAAEKFYAHDTSLVGSIGVIIQTIGAVQAIDKIGVENRVFTSGPNKAILDPLAPLSEDHRKRIYDLIDVMQSKFVAVVENSRGAKLTGDPEEVFSGAFWPADVALGYGLIDGLGNIKEVALSEFGVSEISDYTKYRSEWERFLRQIQVDMGLASLFGVGKLKEIGYGDTSFKPYYLAP